MTTYCLQYGTVSVEESVDSLHARASVDSLMNPQSNPAKPSITSLNNFSASQFRQSFVIVVLDFIITVFQYYSIITRLPRISVGQTSIYNYCILCVETT